MTWLMWRQHRLQLILAAGLVALFAVPVLITGTNLAQAFDACRTSSDCSGGQLFANYNSITILINLTVAVPLIVGLFWGASLLSREFEAGTSALVWTQSVTRRRWLRIKIVSLLVSAALVGAAVSGLVTWWSGPRNATVESRFTGLQFDIQGVAPVAYSVFAAALGLAAGALWRRSLPAMATTLGAFFAVRLLVELYLRPHYMAAVVRDGSMASGSDTPAGAWVSRTELVLHGRVITGPVRVPSTCDDSMARAAMSKCMGGLGYQIRAVYQPAGRYWTFQWIECGIFAVLAALLVVATVVVLRRRDV